MSNNVLNELNLLKNCLKQFNGQPIQGAVRSKPFVLLYDKMKKMIESVKDTEIPFEQLIISDASELSAYVYTCDKIVTVMEYDFTPHEISLPSTYRELLALKVFLIKNNEYFAKKSFDVF